MEPTDLARILADNVRRLLAERGWNQTELAEKLEWSTGNLSRLLTAKRSPGADVLIQLAKVFGCPPHELITPAEETKPAAKPKKK